MDNTAVRNVNGNSSQVVVSIAVPVYRPMDSEGSSSSYQNSEVNKKERYKVFCERTLAYRIERRLRRFSRKIPSGVIFVTTFFDSKRALTTEFLLKHWHPMNGTSRSFNRNL